MRVLLKICGPPDRKRGQKEFLAEVVLSDPLDSQWTRMAMGLAQLVAG